MAWMVQSKGRLLHLRDGDGPDRPLYVVDDKREYPFEHLPNGVRPEHDSDAFYRRVDESDQSYSGAEKAPTLADNLLMEKMERDENAAMHARAREDAAKERGEQPVKRKSRVRAG